MVPFDFDSNELILVLSFTLKVRQFEPIGKMGIFNFEPFNGNLCPQSLQLCYQKLSRSDGKLILKRGLL